MATPSARTLDVLHVVGGTSCLGGVMSFVTKLAGSHIPGIRQSVWKHRDFATPVGSQVNWVCKGAARATDVSILRDLIGMARDAPRLRSWTRHHPNSILYGHGRMGMVAAALSARLSGAPLLVHVHARAGRPSLYRRLWQWSRATVLFNSPQTCRHYGYNPETNPVFMPPISWPSACANEDPDRTHPARFVAAGMFVPCKNLHILVDGFKRLLASERGAELRLFGDSPEMDSDYQRRVIATIQGNAAIQRMGWDPNWTARLRPTDIFVHASQVEAFGIVILEAFARGCRLVVPRETFLDDLPAPLDRLGIVRAEQINPEGYRSAMQDALAIQPPEGGYWEARKQVSGWFSTESTNERLAGLYRLVAAEGRRGE